MKKEPAESTRPWAVRCLEHNRLPVALALIGTLLALPSLWVGFHLDDYVHAYLLSDLPGSGELLRAYESPFGIANGEPEVNQWQMEKGFAPWWTHPRLLISLWRPIAELGHRLDWLLWPGNAVAMHAHSLLWFAALILAAAALYRRVLGPGTVGGLAALLYAFDHTHGFAVGWIANRNALITACFGALAISAHWAWRSTRSRVGALLAPVLFLCGLLSGEAAVAVLGYLLSYALFVERGSPGQRALGLLPCAAVAIGWRATYSLLGHGAWGSGLYIDPVREPLRFAAAAVERLPLLIMGQFALPPAELYMLVSRAAAVAIWLFALLLLLWFCTVAAALLLRDPLARFWAFGMFCSLLSACATHPNNRLLFFSGLGAMALLSQLWHGLMEKADWLLPHRAWRFSAHLLVATITGLHLLVSPLLLPFAACSIVLTGPVNGAVAAMDRTSGSAAGAGEAGEDLVVVSSPDDYFVKLLPVMRALEHRPGPRRLRALSFGPVALEVTRVNSRALSVRFGGGILNRPILELYRDARLPMRLGQAIELEGLRIEITGLTGDGRAEKATFTFDRDLNAAGLRWLTWQEDRYLPFQPPAVGVTARIAPARIPFGLDLGRE